MSSFAPCAVCGQQTTNWCSRCQSRFYCCEQHLQADWPQHRLSCVAVIAATGPAPPAAQYNCFSPYQSHLSQNPAAQQVYPLSQNFTPSLPTEPTMSFKAVYLPKDDENPRLVDVICIPRSNPDSCPCPEPIVSPFLPTSSGQEPSTMVLTQGMFNKLRFPLQVWYFPGSNTENRAILRITSYLDTPCSWKGDVLVMKYRGSRMRGYMNATWLDVPVLAMFFVSQK